MSYKYPEFSRYFQTVLDSFEFAKHYQECMEDFIIDANEEMNSKKYKFVIMYQFSHFHFRF